jgi:predicted Zn-dependent peptidase
VAEIEARLDLVIRGELDPKKVVDAKSAIRGRLLLGMETNADLGWWLAEMALYIPDGDEVPDLFANVEAVTPADVARVARLYLSPEKRFQAIHRPGLTPTLMRGPLLVGAGLALTALGAWWVARSRAHKS